MQSGILLFNNDTLDLLKQKHKKSKQAHESIPLIDTPEDTQSIKLESISAEVCRKQSWEQKEYRDHQG